MKFNPDRHHRRSVRLQGWDYGSRGAYFVTVCTHGRECVFGRVMAGRMISTEAGRMVESAWNELPRHYPHVALDSFIVMPNHVHGILVLKFRRGESRIRPQDSGVSLQEGEHKVRPYGTSPGTIGRIVQTFKSAVTRRYVAGVKEYGWPPFSGRLWQRNYYEHILRGEDELNGVREYVLHNPMTWTEDENHPENVKNHP